MASAQTSAVAAPASRTPYQLDFSQTTKACNVLLKHIRDERKRRDAEAPKKPSLLSTGEGNDDNDGETEGAETPLWLIATTKKHIVDKPRLKPGKIALPHPLNSKTTSTICLITSDPQSVYTDAISHASFPESLRKRITKVIGLAKLKSNYKMFEARRQLKVEHDIFLCDDRVVTYLPQVLGKVFFKDTSKRPIPVNIAGGAAHDEKGNKIKTNPGQTRKSTKDGVGKAVGSTVRLVNEINKALISALIHLAPGTSTAVRIGQAAFTEQMCAENIQAVANGLTEKFITNGWRNVRALHIKGPNTMAFPVWLADQLWQDEQDVLEYEKKKFGRKAPKTLEASSSTKLIGMAATTEDDGAAGTKRRVSNAEIQDPAKVAKRRRKVDKEASLAADTLLRKSKLKQQRDAAMAAAVDTVG